MPAFIISIGLGIVLIVIGISNIKGNINSIHSYHRHRVKDIDKPIFGKLMGIGTILCGVGIIVFGLLFLIGQQINKIIFVTIGSCLTLLGLVLGVIIMICATIKYNKGVF